MPHAVEIILARPATPGELRHARRSVPVAANADRTRLMAVQYALASPTTYTDPTGNNPMIAGCVAGGLMDGGLDWLTQRLSGRKVNWGQVGQSAAIGCLSGMLGEGLGAMFEGRLGSKLGSCSLPNSFTGDTPVLMADGTRKPIKDVEVGDTILATDPETGDTGPRKVTALIKETATNNSSTSPSTPTGSPEPRPAPSPPPTATPSGKQVSTRRVIGGAIAAAALGTGVLATTGVAFQRATSTRDRTPAQLRGGREDSAGCGGNDRRSADTFQYRLPGSRGGSEDDRRSGGSLCTRTGRSSHRRSNCDREDYSECQKIWRIASGFWPSVLSRTSVETAVSATGIIRTCRSAMNSHLAE